MLKKILLTSAVAALTITQANAMTAPYVGAGLGITVNTSSNVSANSAGSPANYRGVPFNVFAGYGGIINQNFYLSGEVTGTVGTADLDNNNNLKTSYAYGVSVLPGVMLSDNTMAFLRAGVVRTRFSNANETRTGGQIGVGLQTCLTQNVDLRGEYIYTGYRSFNSTHNVSAPRSDAVNLSLVYKLD